MLSDLARIRSIADYQFGEGCGEVIFPENVTITYSKNTGRIRHIYLDNILLATLKPTDGLFSITLAGGSRLLQCPSFKSIVKVKDEVAEFVMKGRSLFAKHVLEADGGIKPGGEVVVVDSNRKIVAVGKATLNGKEMLVFKTGVAVKTRKGGRKSSEEE
ncbi:pseudouridine synthase [Candidatus Bathyarchaeota archaeon]|nr:pseudouridine synthase [Candidatus Bathyarchaeota archaeon]MBS7631580.1 pseudouridine synthase [Candidatus Bathyarchaeota archaeon]